MLVMLGVLLTLAFAGAVAWGSQWVIARWSEELDPAERLGVGGILGLGAIGLAMLFVLYLPSGVVIATGLAFALVIVGIVMTVRTGRGPSLKITRPQGPALLAVVVLIGLALIPLIAVLAPSDSTDWDSLAYHLAVPKLWLMAGKASYVAAIHHSNFPFTVDNLYLLGLQWGDQSGAKAFSLAFLAFGGIGLFGLTRRWYGEKVAWWSPLALFAAPVILWESGTAYIDVAHGLFAGLGLLYAGEYVSRKAKDEPSGAAFWLSCVALSMAAGSKYTGLQIIAVTALAVLIVSAISRKGQGMVAFRGAAALAALALLFASPWYIKSAALVQNPVYPFFSGVLGGRDWGEWHAAVYKDEQQSFGVGRTESGRDQTQFGHAVLGLAYQPGRYVNPQQQLGLGFPTGAIGFVGLLALVFWSTSGRAGPREKTVLLALLWMFVLWFFLSQQSRYLTSVVVPGAVLAAGAISRLRMGAVLAVGIALQAIYTGWMLWTSQTSDQLQVVLGKVNSDEYQTARISFYPAATSINENQSVRRVALYDEVFGYLLSKPYLWANPGHSTVIPYARLESGRDFGRELADQGFSHIYMNLQFMERGARDRWLAAAGIIEGEPYSEEEKATMFADPNLKWRWLIADGHRSGALRIVEQFNRSLLLDIEAAPVPE